MFDFDGAKLIIIGIVMLIVIKPKDLPGVMRQVGQAVAQLRRMAAEFQGQFHEAMRESEMHDLKKDVEKMTRLDIDGLNPLDSVRGDLATVKADIDHHLNTPASPSVDAEIDAAEAALKSSPAAHIEPAVQPEAAPVHGTSTP